MNKFSLVKVLKSNVVYGKYGRKVVADTIEYADGSTHEWIYFKDGEAVGVIALTEDGKIVLTKEYRHPMGGIVLNLPGGAVEKEETLPEAAQREFEEETGFTAKKLQWIGKYSPGPNTQVIVNLFLARNIERKGAFDKQEIAEVKLMDFKTILKRVQEGECFDSALVVAVLLAASNKLFPP
jgi:ADP-ribose pyrophosphatase